MTGRKKSIKVFGNRVGKSILVRIKSQRKGKKEVRMFMVGFGRDDKRSYHQVFAGFFLKQVKRELGWPVYVIPQS